MVRHPKVAKVASTDSTPERRHSAVACRALLRPVTLELGGNSSAFVMEREEIFGPVITILKYHDRDEAFSLANNTGSVGLNFFAFNHAAPFGGRNDSGLGVEYGPEGLAAYSCKICV